MTKPVMVREYQPPYRHLGESGAPIHLAAEPWAADAAPLNTIPRTRKRTQAERRAATLAFIATISPSRKMSAKAIAEAMGEDHNLSQLLISLHQSGLVTLERKLIAGAWKVHYGPVQK